MSHIPKPLTAAIAAIAMALQANAGDDSLQGLSGPDLLQAVGRAYAPTVTLTAVTGPNSIWQAFRSTDARPDGTVNDRFSTTVTAFSADGDTPPDGLDAVSIAPPRWWGLSRDNATTITRDLHNIIPAPTAFHTAKADYPPGTVTTVTDQGQLWAVGTLSVDGTEIGLYQPPADMRGDCARAILYMLAVYPCPLWQGNSVNYLNDNTYPILNNLSRPLLLAWHHSDPVDATELARDTAIAAIQGNHNPFVTQPTLADHIWGDAADTPYDPASGGDDPSQPDTDTLRPTYRLTDTAITLASPYIPADATWTVDSIPVVTATLSPAAIGAGTHELRYSSPSATGKILIVITP